MTTKLAFYWYDFTPSEEINVRQTQLFAAVRRIAFVSEQLESVLNMKPTEDMLERLQYHAENYLVRAYELRERAERLVVRLQRSRKMAGTKVSATLPNLTEALERVKNIIDIDIDLRRRHTHDRFLLFGIWTGSTIFECRDVFLQFDESRRAELTSILRREAKLFVAEYRQKCADVIEATMSLITAINKARSEMDS